MSSRKVKLSADKPAADEFQLQLSPVVSKTTRLSSSRTSELDVESPSASDSEPQLASDFEPPANLQLPPMPISSASDCQDEERQRRTKKRKVNDNAVEEKRMLMALNVIDTLVDKRRNPEIAWGEHVAGGLSKIKNDVLREQAKLEMQKVLVEYLKIDLECDCPPV